jgi:hypothetical protein
MTTWEYKVITLKAKSALSWTDAPSDSDTQAVLAREGSQGWELVNARGLSLIGGVTLYFKRPR